MCKKDKKYGKVVKEIRSQAVINDIPSKCKRRTPKKQKTTLVLQLSRIQLPEAINNSYKECFRSPCFRVMICYVDVFQSPKEKCTFSKHQSHLQSNLFLWKRKKAIPLFAFFSRKKNGISNDQTSKIKRNTNHLIKHQLKNHLFDIQYGQKGRGIAKKIYIYVCIYKMQ